MMRQVALEVPIDLRDTIREQVFINVAVDIDRAGKVTAAEVASTRGADADLLTAQALKAARWFRFRPNRQGSKTTLTQTVLTFVFDPETKASPPEDPPPSN
jgi:TonB family protein